MDKVSAYFAVWDGIGWYDRYASELVLGRNRGTLWMEILVDGVPKEKKKKKTKKKKEKWQRCRCG